MCVVGVCPEGFSANLMNGIRCYWQPGITCFGLYQFAVRGSAVGYTISKQTVNGEFQRNEYMVYRAAVENKHTRRKQNANYGTSSTAIPSRKNYHILWNFFFSSFPFFIENDEKYESYFLR